MIIKLVRHGRSQQQSGEVNSTWDHNVDLTQQEESSGVLQARKVGKIIGGKFISQALLYVSPYLCARRTMYEMIGVDGADAGEYVNSTRDLRIYEDARLREMEWGFNNKTKKELTKEEEYREQFDWFYYRLQGSESPADVYDRVSTFIDSLHRQMERKRKTRAVVVSHGITIRCFVMRWLHLSVEQYVQIKNPDNCDIITITDKNCLQNPQFTSGKWGVAGLRLREEKALA